MTIALIAVLLGVFRLLPGLGVLLAIIVAPAWIATCARVAFTRSDRGQVSLGQKAGIFAASLAMVIGIGVMLIAALVGAFGVFCGFILAPEDSKSSGIAFLIALGAALVIAAGVAIMGAAWKRSRQSNR